MKAKIEFILTIVILFLIYAFITNEQAIGLFQGKAADVVLQQQTAMPEKELRYIDPYAAAETIEDQNTLRTMAKDEAGRMMTTGDTSRYEQELQKDPHAGRLR